MNLSDELEKLLVEKLRVGTVDEVAGQFGSCVNAEAKKIVDDHGEMVAPLIIISMVNELLSRYEHHGESDDCAYVEEIRAIGESVIDAARSLDFAMDRMRAHIKDGGQ